MSSFDTRAKDWDKENRRVQLAKSVANGIKNCIERKNLHILDFGCGTGLVSMNLRDIALSITGLDTSKEMVARFNAKTTSPNIQAFSKPLDDFGKFDLIVTSMTLHHIEDIDTLLEKFHEHLQKDGFVCIADLYEEDGTFHDMGNEGVFHFGFDPDILLEKLRTLGFELLCKRDLFIIKKKRDYGVFLLCVKKR